MTNLKTFAITPRGQSVFVFITAEDFDNLQQWMPYIAWSGSYLESYVPMRQNISSYISKSHL